MVSWAAAPAASAMDPDVAPVSPPDANDSEYVPTWPVSPSPLKVASPLASVVALVPPISDAPAPLTDTVTDRPACETGLPLWSCTRTEGWLPKTTPLCAELDGWFTMASDVAAPAVMLTA